MWTTQGNVEESRQELVDLQLSIFGGDNDDDEEDLGDPGGEAIAVFGGFSDILVVSKAGFS